MVPKSSVFAEMSKWLNELPVCRRVDVRALQDGVVVRLEEKTRQGLIDCGFAMSSWLVEEFRGDLFSIQFREAAEQLQKAVDRVERDEEPTIQDGATE